MEDNIFNLTFDHFLEIPRSDHTSIYGISDWDKPSNREYEESLVDEEDESLEFSMVCDAGSRLIPSGFTRTNCPDEIVMFIIAGGSFPVEVDSSMKFMADSFFEGGDVFQTDEPITDAGDFAFLYQSARIGNFCYHLKNVPSGEYYIDLHFVEIINTYGPKGMRVFNVFVQDEKVLSNFDIFSVVGANKPLQVVNSRVSVKDDGLIVIRFEGVTGSPLVSGICVRRASSLRAPQLTYEYLVCSKCAAKVEVPSAQEKVMRMKSTAKYEKKIEELNIQCQRKTDECYQAWMSLTAANEQLEKVRMELDSKSFRTYSLDQTVEKQAEKLKNISSKYESDKKFWSVAVNNLEEKIKVMKEEHSQLSREAHECVSSIPELNKMVYAIQSLVEQCEDLKVKYSEEQAKRRKLYNQVQEAKGNIRVFCRCRPLSKAEIAARHSMVVDFDAAKDGELGIMSGGSSKKTFKFDRVYTPNDDQVGVFADASPMVISVLDGYNVCIFAYGQTGTGKTFTMEGTEKNRGVNYRTVEELFKIASERSETFSYNISVSVLEVYNEQIRDLLAASPTSKKLEIKQASEGFHHVPGLVEAKVENISEVWNVLQAGSRARAVGSNNVNEHSSRSHCMLCIMVRAKNLLNGECIKSKLWLVDLAGSERLAKTDAQGDRLKEAQNINKSLSALGDVISALANKSSHIPYRNSKLTHLLQDSLGGDSKILMFVQISPSEQDLSETLSSLNFATRVRGVELGPARKQIDTSELQKLRMMLDKARQESRSKDESIRKLEESLQNLESKARGKDQFHKSQLEKVKELEAQLEMKIALHSQSEKQVTYLSDRLKGKEDICTGLWQKVKELEDKLAEQEQSELTTYQQVRDLQIKLKDQARGSQSCTLILQQKIEELEMKLKEQEQRADSILHQKIKELEDKLREQDQQLATRASQVEGKRHPREECMDDDTENHIRTSSNSVKRCVGQDSITDAEQQQHILRSSNFSINRRGSQGSASLKGNESSLYETRRKRLSRNSETENNAIVSAIISDDNKGRKSDPPKLFSRTTTRTVSKPVVTTQRPMAQNRVNRDQAQGIKEKDTKKRAWSRW